MAKLAPPSAKKSTILPNLFASQPQTALPGSNKPAFPTGSASRPVPPGTSITVSVLLRRKFPLNTETIGEKRLTRAQYRAQHGTDPAALKALLAFAKAYALTPAHDPARRIVTLTGTASQLQTAFGVTLTLQTAPDGNLYRVRAGDIHLPESLQGQVEAVLGLDDRPQAGAHFRIAHSVTPGGTNPAVTSSSFTPPQIAGLYQFPANASAAGQTIGLIELGGGYRTADLSAYFKTLGLAAPKVVAVSIDGGKNSPSTADGADGEVMLDIEVAASVAPAQTSPSTSPPTPTRASSTPSPPPSTTPPTSPA